MRSPILQIHPKQVSQKFNQAVCSGHKWILGELLDPSKNRALRFSKSSMPRAEIGKAFTIGRWQSFLVMGNGVLVFDGFHSDMCFHIDFVQKARSSAIHCIQCAHVAVEKVTEGPKKGRNYSTGSMLRF